MSVLFLKPRVKKIGFDLEDALKIFKVYITAVIFIFIILVLDWISRFQSTELKVYMYVVLFISAILVKNWVWRQFCFYSRTANHQCLPANQALSTNAVMPLEEVHVTNSNGLSLEAVYNNNSGISPPPPYSEVVEEYPPPSYDVIFL